MVVSRDPIMSAIARNVRAERQKAGLSQQALAKRCGLSVRYISRLETTPQNIRVDKLCVLANALGVPPSRLLDATSARHKPAVAEIVADIEEAMRLLQGIRTRVG